MKALIVDDEKESRAILQHTLAMFCPQVEVVSEAQNVHEALQKVQQTEVLDIVFLDIQMPDGTGFDFLKKLSKINFEVIFTTAYDQFSLKAFEYSAIDYLLKPIDPELLVKAVNKVSPRNLNRFIEQKVAALMENYTQNSFKKIGVLTPDGMEFIEIQKIIRCEANDNYTNIFIAENFPKKALLNKTLSALEELLPQNMFFKIHKSHIINLHRISKFIKEDGGFLLMEDGNEIPIARRRKDALIKRLEVF
ncbi:MAG: LytTR family DNA-binding domain-containing protein [Chitinophagales bacterium]|nr:response regulator transcription factor [Bacteroidota bacterium]MCB9044265.1 response regulator transcription factor [Chitinophagales bacterium]